MNLTFVELPMFSRAVNEIADELWLVKLQDELCAWPERGALMPRLGGLRKVRMPLAGTGRRGGSRVLYLLFQKRAVIVLVYAYRKAAKATIGPELERQLRRVVEEVKEEFNR